MATLDPKKGVPGIPLGALDAISDENTRQVLRAMVDGWHVRNGSSGTGESAFVTKGEMSGLKTTGWFSGNNQAPDASKTQIKPGDINRIINDLQAQVMESLLFKELGERIKLIQIDGSKNAADISSEVTKRLNDDNAIVNSTNTQFTVINGNVAAVQSQTNTLSNNVSSVAQQLYTLQSQVGSNLSALQLEADTRANADGDLYAKYSVKIDQNGYVSGFGLMSTANNSTPFSEFIVRADRFAIGSPSGPGVAARVPFIVTTGYDGNGNPPGVYMDMAVMRNASIKRAMIGDAEVDTLKIAGNAVTLPFSTSFGYVSYGQQVASGWQYLEGGSKIIIIVTYTVMHMQFHGANMTIGVACSDGGRAWVNGSGFSFENYGNGVVSGAYITPYTGWWAVTAQPGGEAGGVCTGLVITAQGAQR